MSPAASAREIVERTLAAPPTLGAGRLLCIDGPSGSGKTTLANEVLVSVPDSVDVALVHMDDIYPGWGGLVEGVERAGRLLVGALAEGEAAGYHRYDWSTGSEAEWIAVPPVDLLILEGVGTGTVEPRAAITTLAWMETPRPFRIARSIERDGHEAWEHLARWRRDEDAHFARHRTREHADVVLEGDAAPSPD